MKKFCIIIFLLCFAVCGLSAQESGMWDNFGNNINNAFFFVIDKIANIQGFFLGKAWEIGQVVLLIAILSAALNYALTGTGLKENVIKISKALIFFIIIWFAYPNIIGFITRWTYDMAEKSIYPDIKKNFSGVTMKVEDSYNVVVGENYIDNATMQMKLKAHTFTKTFIKDVLLGDTRQLFSNDLTVTRRHAQLGSYTVMSPASVLKIIFLLAGQCTGFADGEKDKGGILPNISEFSRVLKGLICAFVLIFTGIFALLEYIMCFLEFMLVSGVGIILFPLSIWEGSKFMAEKFVGAIIGFFMKLLFCNLAIFLLLYGFISLFYILEFTNRSGFSGTPDQIIFIIFTCMLFFFICKSAPGIAQSLLTGIPSLSASGAISAASGMVGAAAATAGLAKKAGQAGAAVAGGTAVKGLGVAGTIMSANAAYKASGGSLGAAFSSVGADIKTSALGGVLGLTKSLMGGKGGNPYSWKNSFLNGKNAEGGSYTFANFKDAVKQQGIDRGLNYSKEDEKLKILTGNDIEKREALRKELLKKEINR